MPGMRRLKREDSVLKKSFQGREDVFRSEDVFRAAKAGDMVCLRVIHQMGRYLGIGIASFVNIFNPDMIVLSGGVTAAWKDFIDMVEAEVQVRAFEVPRKRVSYLNASQTDTLQQEFTIYFENCETEHVLDAIEIVMHFIEKADAERLLDWLKSAGLRAP